MSGSVVGSDDKRGGSRIPAPMLEAEERKKKPDSLRGRRNRSGIPNIDQAEEGPHAGNPPQLDQFRTEGASLGDLTPPLP